MDEEFTIYIDRLAKGAVEVVNETVAADFLEQDDEFLCLKQPVKMKGEAYIAEDELILHLNIETEALVPCAICQKPLQFPIRIRNFYHAEPLDQIADSVYNFRELVRQTVLLCAPEIVECNEGHCPEREKIKQYLRKPNAEEEKYRPFAELNFNLDNTEEQE